MKNHLFAVSLAPGKREAHKRERNRTPETDVNKPIYQNKNENQRNGEIYKYLNGSIREFRPNWTMRGRARFYLSLNSLVSAMLITAEAPHSEPNSTRETAVYCNAIALSEV